MKHKERRGRKKSGRGSTPPAPSKGAGSIRSRYKHFAALFSLSCIGLYAVIFLLPDQFINPINEHTARTLGYALNLMGFSALVAGDQVLAQGFAVRIIPECTALLMVGLFVSFVIFYPAPVSKKAKGLMVGISVLYLGNVIRLVLVFIAGMYSRRLFDAIHVYLGQVFTIAMVLSSCLVYLKWLDHEEKMRSNAIKTVGFFVRFALISGCIFFLWMEIHHRYVWFVDRIMIFGFSLSDYRLIIPRNMGTYWETFNMVTFTSLVVAMESISGVRKIKSLVGGIGVLFVLHLFHRINNTFMTAFGVTWIMPADIVLCAVAQYLLPVLLWLFVAFYSPPTQNATSG